MRSIKFDKIGQKEIVRGVRPVNPPQASLTPAVVGSAPKPPAPPVPAK